MITPAIDLARVTVTCAGRAVLDDVTLDLPPGRLALVVGRTGAGKSTLLRVLTGLVPRSGDWELRGDVHVHGAALRDLALHEVAQTVAYVPAPTDRSFVARTVEAEVAFGLEQHGVPGAALRRRVEDALDLLGIEDLRDRACASLSAGQQQRAAIAAALAVGARVLVLDEPTSALDPVGADAVCAAVGRLVHDLGVTVVAAEHRTDRLAAAADVVWTVTDGAVGVDAPRTALRAGPHAPVVAHLAGLRGWHRVPLTVREARDLHVAAPTGAREVATTPERTTDAPAAPAPGAAPVVRVRGLVARYGPRTALDGVDLDVAPGTVVAVTGRNGSGKSTLLWSLVGARRRDRGTVSVRGHDPARTRASTVRRLVTLVPHDPDVLLGRETVAAELAAADRAPGAAPGRAADLLRSLAPALDTRLHPQDLSHGQRLALALAVQLATDPPVVLLDEPSHGLDTVARDALVRRLRAAARDHGRTVVVATHDLDLTAELADRVVVLARGRVVADGPVREVLTGDPVARPQVARVDPRWLRLADAVREPV